jgi:hypothetical protein
VRVCGIEEVYFHAFLISEINGGVDNFTGRPLCVQRTSCVGSGFGLDGLARRREEKRREEKRREKKRRREERRREEEKRREEKRREEKREEKRR